MGNVYHVIENKVLLIGIFISKIEVVFSNQLDAAIFSLNYDLFLTNMPEMLCSYIHKEAPVLNRVSMQMMTQSGCESHFTFGCDKVLFHKSWQRAGRAFSHCRFMVGDGVHNELKYLMHTVANVRHDFTGSF